MKVMKKLLGAAAIVTAASAAFAGTASAEGSFSGNVALTSDYVFRGQSQTQGDPAIQGGLDYVNDIFYLGTWASSLDFGSGGGLAVDSGIEVDVYAGFRPVLGPVTMDIGVIGYFYPGSGIDDLEMVELKVGGSVVPMENLTLGLNAFWSPEFTLNGGDSLYLEGVAGYTFSPELTVSGGVAQQTVDTAGYFILPVGAVDSYTTWNVGGTFSAYGFGFDLRYFDSDEDITNLASEVVSDERFVFTLKRAL